MARFSTLADAHPATGGVDSDVSSRERNGARGIERAPAHVELHRRAVAHRLMRTRRG